MKKEKGIKVRSKISSVSKKEHTKEAGKMTKKQGIALAETILLIAVSLVIIISIFYPIFRNIINETLASVANWYTNALTTLSIN